MIDERIRPALESGSRIDSSKPTLVVIDEIDGATGGGDSVSKELVSTLTSVTNRAQSMGFISRLVQLTQEKIRKKGKLQYIGSSRALKQVTS